MDRREGSPMNKKCSCCGEIFDSQFITTYERVNKINNTSTLEKINVCEYCEIDNGEVDELEENRTIELNGLTYYYEI